MGETFEVVDEKDLSLQENTPYRAQLMELKTETFKWTDFKDKDRPGVPIEKEGKNLVWWWQVYDEDTRHPETGAYRRVRGKCNPKITALPDNTFRLWATAILQRDLPIGFKVDADDLVGGWAYITIKKEKGKNDKVYESVDEVLPAEHFTPTTDEPPF